MPAFHTPNQGDAIDWVTLANLIVAVSALLVAGVALIIAMKATTRQIRASALLELARITASTLPNTNQPHGDVWASGQILLASLPPRVRKRMKYSVLYFTNDLRPMREELERFRNVLWNEAALKYLDTPGVGLFDGTVNDQYHWESRRENPDLQIANVRLTPVEKVGDRMLIEIHEAMRTTTDWRPWT